MKAIPGTAVLLCCMLAVLSLSVRPAQAVDIIGVDVAWGGGPGGVAWAPANWEQVGPQKVNVMGINQTITGQNGGPCPTCPDDPPSGAIATWDLIVRVSIPLNAPMFPYVLLDLKWLRTLNNSGAHWDDYHIELGHGSMNGGGPDAIGPYSPDPIAGGVFFRDDIGPDNTAAGGAGDVQGWSNPPSVNHTSGGDPDGAPELLCWVEGPGVAVGQTTGFRLNIQIPAQIPNDYFEVWPPQNVPPPVPPPVDQRAYITIRQCATSHPVTSTERTSWGNAKKMFR